MSDWECDDNEDGIDTQKPAPKAAPTEWKLPGDDRQRERVFFGLRRRAPRGCSDDCIDEGSEFNRRRSGAEGRPVLQSTARRTFGDVKSDSSPPVTFTVKNASVGRVIGKLGFYAVNLF